MCDHVNIMQKSGTGTCFVVECISCLNQLNFCLLEKKTVLDKQEKRNQDHLKYREERLKEERMKKRWVQHILINI